MPDVTQHPIFEPDGTITVYKNVPLDKSYEHSVNYSTQAAFVTALSAYNHTTLFNQSYSRLTQNSVRVELSFSYLKDCNYMMITDANLYGGKVYFCFIDTVEYINNVTCDIFFTIDVLQTYYHDFTMRENFVEREHCLLSDDILGRNTVPEKLETGELISQSTSHHTYPLFNSYVQPNQSLWHIIIAYTPNWDGANTRYVVMNGGIPNTVQQTYPPSEQRAPQIRNGFMSPVCYLHVEVTLSMIESSIGGLQLIINKINEVNGQVVDIFMIPNEVYSDNFIDTVITPHQFTLTRHTNFKYISKSGSYTPKNIKLFTFPFSSIVVSNNNGGIAKYKWELFTSGNTNAAFGVISVFTPEPILNLYPAQYRNINADFESSLSFEDFPKCSWNEDSFTKWWAQNKTNFGMSLATQALMTGATFATGGISGGATGQAASAETGSLTKSGAFSLGMGAMGIGRTLSQVTVAQDTPDSAHIQNNIPVLNAIQNRFGFVAYAMGVTGEMAEIIDKYFEMYGYATHKVKIPNFISNGRRYWDYVKLQACQIEARANGVGLNGEYIDQIQSIFNNGITLWKSLADVGNYSLDNHTA